MITASGTFVRLASITQSPVCVAAAFWPAHTYWPGWL
jgi:hypothetical protein